MPEVGFDPATFETLAYHLRPHDHLGLHFIVREFDK